MVEGEDVLSERGDETGGVEEVVVVVITLPTAAKGVGEDDPGREVGGEIVVMPEEEGERVEVTGIPGGVAVLVN